MASKSAQEIEIESLGRGSLIADAIAAAADLGMAVARASWSASVVATPVITETDQWYLQQLSPDAPAELVVVPHRRRPVVTAHAALGSFTDWVTVRAGVAGPTPEVFVGPNSVDARWNVATELPRDMATLPLVPCESWNALQQLVAGVGQKDLHKLLTTALHGCIPERLALQVAMLSHYVQSNCDVAISRTGLADVSVSERMSLRFTGGGEDETEEIGVEWTYTGPVWTCFEEPISVPLRMVISKEKDAGLRFEFAPIGSEALLLVYRRWLADAVGSGLAEAGIPVYVGSVK